MEKHFQHHMYWHNNWLNFFISVCSAILALFPKDNIFSQKEYVFKKNKKYKSYFIRQLICGLVLVSYVVLFLFFFSWRKSLLFHVKDLNNICEHTCKLQSLDLLVYCTAHIWPTWEKIYLNARTVALPVYNISATNEIWHAIPACNTDLLQISRC
jgi:succinate dehydrogenase hydrophobic anchor subunit